MTRTTGTASAVQLMACFLAERSSVAVPARRRSRYAC
jgi:hypothetical protein